jgi:APA family basic amino acid/polyamine antiporter
MQPKKLLSLFDLSMIVISFVIGMGIFRTPVSVAANAQIPELFFLAWIIGGIFSYFGALIYAELGSRFPVTGAYYKVFSVSYHPSFAFAINCIVIMTIAASIAGVTLIGSEYLANVMLPPDMQTDQNELIIAIIGILFLFGINLLGLRTSSKVQNIITVIKIGLVLTLICAVFTGGQAQHITPVFKTASGGLPGWWDYGKTLGLCMIAINFSFTGYPQTINLGGEVRDAKRTLPRGIVLGLLIIITLYLLINYTYVKVIGFEQLKTAQSIASILAGKIFGPAGYTILSVIIFISVLGFVNVNLLSIPRSMFAMAEEKAIPSVFTRKNSKTDVMTVSLSTFVALIIATLVFAKTFDKILNYSILLECLATASAGASLFFLRKKTAGLNTENIYTIKWFPLIPILFISFTIFVGVSIYLSDPATALSGLLILAGFMLIYFISKLFNKKTSVLNAD